MSKEKEAAVRQPKEPLSIDPGYVGRIAGVLLAICLVTALLLGVVNQITAPRIEAIQKAKKETAMRNVLAADEYLPCGATCRTSVRPLSGPRRQR